jgi:MFS family permease
MSTPFASTVPLAPATTRAAAGRLSRTAAFFLQASIVVSFLAGSSAPTPLYARYQSAWGLSPVAVTLIFGTYALAVLAALLVVGSLSDHVGRRPVLFVAAGLQAVTMLLFATSSGVGDLLVARVVQGVATGAAAGAVGAGMLDIDRARGTIANAIGPMLGTGTGSLLSGLMAQYLPAPTVLVYLTLGGVFLVQSIGVVFMPESAPRRPGALASLRPQLRLPPRVRGPMLLAAPALVAAWALAGFYGSIGPTLVRRLAGSSSLALGGFTLFVLAVSGAVTVLLVQSRTPRTIMVLGTSALVAGVGITLLAVEWASVPVFFVGAPIAGAGFGAAFQGAIRRIVPLAEPHERAGVMSVLYVVAYLALGLPAILGGLRVVHGGGVFTTAREYGICVMVLAAIALVGTLVRRERS